MNAARRRLAEALRLAARHRVEYLAEALGLGLFMVSACAFATLLWHPASPLAAAVTSELARRALMGLAMGLTLVGLVHSPWGRRSGAHLNPSVSLAFWWLGRARGGDVAGYVLAHFAGATAGVALSAALLGVSLAHPGVDYVATRPGPAGAGVAFAAEFALAFALLGVVLRVADHPRLARWTGVIAGVLLALAILFESPLSGTSMNPARTFGSALAARDWSGFWIYLVAPPLAMLLAAEIYRLELALRGRAPNGCAKLDHAANVRCIFCEWQHRAPAAAEPGLRPAAAPHGPAAPPAGPAPGTSATTASLEGGGGSS